MAQYRSFVLFGAFLCCIVAFVHSGAIDKTASLPSVDKANHNKFFKKLTKSEQHALMSLAISHFNVPTSTNESIFPVQPLVKPKADEIPRTLFIAMMNGDVTNNWMEEFMNWLRKNMGMTDESFRKWLSSKDDKLCPKNDEECIELFDLGAKCCPFG